MQASADKSITFPPGLSNDDRAVVHAECRKARPAAAPRSTQQLRERLRRVLTPPRAPQLGFTSKSHGKGATRCVTVSKARPYRAGERCAAQQAP